MRTLLLTGFEPFDQDAINPSWEAVSRLDGLQLGADVQIVARRLPCAFATAGKCLTQLIDEWQPAMVIAVGLGPGRSTISVERVAINVNDARIPDNLGEQPIDTPVVVDGPAAYFTTLPIKAMVKAVRDAGALHPFRRRRGPLCVTRCFICCSMHSPQPPYAVGLSTCRCCRNR